MALYSRMKRPNDTALNIWLKYSLSERRQEGHDLQSKPFNKLFISSSAKVNRTYTELKLDLVADDRRPNMLNCMQYANMF